MTIRLIREAPAPTATGPFQGQYVLQRALRRYGPAWLKIGGELARGEVPWFWCWEDAQAACRWAIEGRPFILGPNVLFHNSRRPCEFPHERLLGNAPSCRLLFTESNWYRELIVRHLGPRSRAPIAVWPYPVAGHRLEADGHSQSQTLPTEGCPLTTDLLIYAKSGFHPRLPARLEHHFPRTKVLWYGRFRREELFEAARRSRVCVYLSDDDRGPLALAEILVCGCPAVGVPTGAPWIDHGVNGAIVSGFAVDDVLRGVAVALRADRETVAAAACERFHPKTVVRQIVTAIERHLLKGM